MTRPGNVRTWSDKRSGRYQPGQGADTWGTSQPPRSSTSSREEPPTGLPNAQSVFLSACALYVLHGIVINDYISQDKKRLYGPYSSFSYIWSPLLVSQSLVERPQGPWPTYPATRQHQIEATSVRSPATQYNLQLGENNQNPAWVTQKPSMNWRGKRCSYLSQKMQNFSKACWTFSSLQINNLGIERLQLRIAGHLAPVGD